MIDRMLALLREQNMCVLATCDADKPYCSLMAYVTDGTGRTVYMVTLGNSRKYRNLTRNPHVSLLVDTRSLHPESERGGIQALTVIGECSTVTDDAIRTEMLGRIAAVHPHTGELTRQSDARLLAVRVNALLLLDGIDKAHFEALT